MLLCRRHETMPEDGEFSFRLTLTFDEDFADVDVDFYVLLLILPLNDSNH
jgi:hypothetical protein